ncbi:transglutaminase family protein [Chachezhania sediminis]|uniref:transglutaminase family protein n=1 Tax=Chachezhania sediminis TaxID=2599291 RepID=UPI00131E7607|nr:transglutaminase family protein [Chachezhania sediminis]
MSIDVALNHRTRYRYDRLVNMAPHIIRLRPAPHTRTKILSYTQRVSPGEHFVNWQQDPFANYLSRIVFPEKSDHLEVEIDVVARLEAINPFDFFLEEAAQEADFKYDADTAADLKAYMVKPKLTPRFKDFIASSPKQKGSTIDYIVAMNQYVQQSVGYIVRMEPGVQTPEETLTRALGSCRDSGWLLVEMLRELGYAARFVSGYLIQLTADIKPVEGPSGPEKDFTDLHAWCEVYLPGAGWVGLDPTSGLFAGEGHIPLACTPNPRSAAPISGAVDKCEVSFDFEMSVQRLAEPPRSTRPLEPGHWTQILAAGRAVDDVLEKNDVRLTVGGEPTFVCATDRDADEWTIAAVGPTKRAYADRLIRRFRNRFAPGGVLQYGQGKWYPGEQLPRWSFELHWRGDGAPLWNNPDLIALEADPDRRPADVHDAQVFVQTLCARLDVPRTHAIPAFEDPVEFALREQNLPSNSTPETNKVSDPEMRRRLVRVFEKDLDDPVAFVLPLQQAQSEASPLLWLSELWQTRRGRLYLIPGDSAAGLRLPLEALPDLPEGVAPIQVERDSFTYRAPLPSRFGAPPQFQTGAQAKARRVFLEKLQDARKNGEPLPEIEDFLKEPEWEEPEVPESPVGGHVRTALSVEPRNGILNVFLPPLYSTEGYLGLLNALEDTASETGIPIHIEGYAPPKDPRLNVIKVTPDPGVIEVNVHPATNWTDQVHIIDAIYEEARQVGLDASTFMVDGRVTGSGGGNHIVMGGSSPADSPFLRRPDMLASIIRFWQNHPSLSYLFSGLFVGPTSQAPRLDEARHDSLYEMEIALAQLPAPPSAPAWLVDRLFRNLLVDVTGNTHRAEICIDKLYSPDGPAGRLGLIEFRGFEMPPHPRMASAQALVLRALIARFWEKPYTEPLIRWGTTLHDRFLLPHFVWEDFKAVLADLSANLGMEFDPEWFKAQLAFRFPIAGEANVDGTEIEIRNAIEPWPTLGEEGSIGGTTRFVDSSLERVQVTIRNLKKGVIPTVNGVEIPLTKVDDETWVAGVKFRAWWPAHCLHPTIPPHAPLVFDLVDPKQGRSLGGCTYRVAHSGGRAHEFRPINELEAEGRRLARFDHFHTPGPMAARHVARSEEFPLTLDMRRL